MADATGGQIDTSIEIVTPENIAFQHRVAGPFRRLPAYLIDFMIRVGTAAICLVVAIIAFGSVGATGLGVGGVMIIWFILAWFYGGLFEAFWNGQTPGKRLMGIRVVSVEGQPITPFQAILRNILRAVDLMPVVLIPLGPITPPLPLCLVGFVAMMLNNRFQRLGDLPAGTMVVIEEQRFLRGVVRINEPEAIRAAASIPPTFQPSRSLGRVLAGYVQRRQLFPWGRRIEIARHVGEPLRQKFQLPPGTDLDMLLCGLYRRAFIADRTELPPQGDSPFKGANNSLAHIATAVVADGLLQTTEPIALLPLVEEPKMDHGDTERMEAIVATESAVRMVKMSPPSDWERGAG
jgi:uncharacterized RDD family membrane protein YckC